MKPKILVVEDNSDLLFNLDLILKSNNFDTILAKNGKDALNKLSKLEKAPDLIISDILMPQMNGYEFFREISNNPIWNRIPFIFLTARTNPEDIRLGKLLGADDYITKPFDEKDLLASITGRLERTKRIIALEEEFVTITGQKGKGSQIEINKDQIRLLLVFWDDKVGPILKNYYPLDSDNKLSLDDISNQLYSAATSIYGQSKMSKAEGALLKVANFNLYAYLYFDAFPDKAERFGEKQFMLAILAPKISYLESFEIKKILSNLAEKIKKKEKLDLKSYWRSISKILLESVTA